MKRNNDHPLDDPPGIKQQSVPTQSVSLASGKALARAPATHAPPERIPERNDTRHYARHWGINE